MKLVLALVVGILFAAGTYLVLRRTLVQLLLGLAILGNATNLLIFAASGVTAGHAPIQPQDGSPLGPHADPVPQSLILTAIVISFGVIAFALALADRATKELHIERIGEMRSTEES